MIPTLFSNNIRGILVFNDIRNDDIANGSDIIKTLKRKAGRHYFYKISFSIY